MNMWKVSTISNIVISAVLIRFVTTQLQAQDILCREHDFHLHFPNRQMSQHSKVNIAGEKAIEAFTICLWLNTSDREHIGLLRSSGEEDHISLAILPGSERLIFTLLDEDRTLETLPLVRDGNWHGICVTWQSEGGVFMVYYDGRLIKKGDHFKAGVTLSPNRAFTAGVGKQDNILYSGWLGHINAWPRVLEHPLLAVLSSKCGVERGELVSWPQFMEGILGVTVVHGETCPSSESDIPHDLLTHLNLNGEDDVSQLFPEYSATFLEGRLEGHSALYLDETQAYAKAGSFDAGYAFTIACWIKLMASAPYYRAILTSTQHEFIFGVNSDNQLQFENLVVSTKYVYTADNVEENQWHHVAVSFVVDSKLSFFINGFELSPMGSSGFQWQIPSPSSSLEIGRFLNKTDNKYLYFHGYLSDLFVFDRALNAKDIGKLMGRSSPCSYTEWISPPVSPGKAPADKYRNMTCPGVGQCKDVRPWVPGDCREALLATNRTSGVYTVSPLNNEHEFQVFCDHDTHGGGWTVIQRRGRYPAVNFNRTSQEYKTGFGTVDGKSDMWLGNDKIHSLTMKNTELLIQLQAANGNKSYAIYSDFHVADEPAQYKLSLGEFSGSLPDSFGAHSGSIFTTHLDCAPGSEDGGWWYKQCGSTVLNSGSMRWIDFPLESSPLTLTEMKIRRTNGFTGDYNLKFPTGSIGYLKWPNILTAFKAFSVCLWLKFRPPSHDRWMSLLRYSLTDRSFAIKYHTAGDLRLTFWKNATYEQFSSSSPINDDIWHHICVTWVQDQGMADIYIDSSHTSSTGKGDRFNFTGDGVILIGNVPGWDHQFEGQITYMNMWDTRLSTASIQNMANSCGTEAGNVLHWSFFSAMAQGDVQYGVYSSIFPKERYHWTFDRSSTTESFDIIELHKASLTEARISADRPSVVIEDEGYFVAHDMSSDLSNDTGFTVSFSMKQTAMASDILQDDFENLEVLRTAFPIFIRDNAMWKRCYSADQASWRTMDFHSSCDHKGPSLTVIRVGEYVFGGFVEQSWGGPAAEIGNQHEGFLFSLSNPSNESPRILPVQGNKTSARTDPHLGPSFGQRDLELFQDDTGRLMGFSGLGASFSIENISLSVSEARNFFAGSQQFYPDRVEVFCYHVPSSPVGLEIHTIEDAQLNSSSVLDASHSAFYARLNDARGRWCSRVSDANSWLQVLLGRQYTLTHIALQGTLSYNVETVTVKYEKTRDGDNWIMYSKSVNGSLIPKIVRVNRMASSLDALKEAFFPPFEAVKVRLELGEGPKCMKMELYFYDAGCSQEYGVEDGTIPNERFSASMTIEPAAEYAWPFRGRLNHNYGSKGWGPSKSPSYGYKDNWFQVDLEKEKEVTCIATQGRSGHNQYTTKYEVSYSSNGHDWKFYKNSNGEKELTGNSDASTIVTNRLIPPINGRFIRLHLTECFQHCRVRMELYGKRTISELIPFGHGLYFLIRYGQYHILFANESLLWEIRHPLILDKWFEATLTWKADDGLKFYVNGNLMASDTSPSQLVPAFMSNEPFTLGIGSDEYSGGWSRSVSIDDVSVWSMALSEEKIKRKTEVFLDFDDNSRNWTEFLAGSSDWKLTHGCTAIEGTGPCDDVSGGGHYIYFGASNLTAHDYGFTARFVIPLKLPSSYSCVKFHYHMWGMHAGRLNIYSMDHHGNTKLLWRLFGDQNDTWKEAKIPVNVPYLQYQVIFEAHKGSGYLGDIAIDEIAFTWEKCSLVPLFASPNSSGEALNSTIIRMDTVYNQHLSTMLREAGHGLSWWRPCYHALDHGWDVSSFHQRCDNKGPTITIVRKDNYVFGGFTEQSWEDTYELLFEREDPNDYVKAQWSSPINILTASMWIKSSANTKMTLFTFGSSSSDMVQFSIIGATAGFCFWQTSQEEWSLQHNLTPNPVDGFWHHLTVVWQSLSNTWELHIDGTFIGEASWPLWRSKHIPGGDLLIGQNRHLAKYWNSAADSFIGRMTSFNMWDYKWDRPDIASLAQSCETRPGNVFQWRSIKDNLHGEVKLVQPSSCKAHSSYDLYFWRQDPHDCVEDHFSAPIPELTVSLWMKTSNILTKFRLFSFGNSTANVVFKITQSGMSSALCLKFDAIDSGKQCITIPLSSNVVDGFWHHLAIQWKSSENKWKLHKDGIFQGEGHNPHWSQYVIPGGTLYIGRKFALNYEHAFMGRITSFNMWNTHLPDQELSLLAQNCRKEQGTLFQWNNLKDKVKDQLRVVEPSSCSSTSYKSDSKAFIFSLNYTSQGSLFKKEITEASSSTAIYSSPTSGPTFGEAPFDFQIGINGSMKDGSSHHIISYTKGSDVADANPETLLAGAALFNVSDVEVLYKGHGGSLCHQQCPYNYNCDEIRGGCRCKFENDFPLLCQLYKFYSDCAHFWPLDSNGNVEDLVTHTWGQAIGGVQNAFGLLTDGVSGKIQLLDDVGESCATRFIDSGIYCEGFTVGLRLMYWNRADGQRQVFFKSFVKFIIYQERNDSLIVRIERGTKFCLKEMAMPEKIWSYLVFSFKTTVRPRILTIYRNGHKLDEFLSDKGCDNRGAPEFISHAVTLGAGFGTFAQAKFAEVAIWNQVLSDERVAELSNAHTNMFPFKVRLVVRITNQSWHDDLYLPGTMRYKAMTNDIQSNVTSFYSNFPEVNASVTVNKYSPGSVVANFSIEYNVTNFSLIQELNDTMSKTGHLNNMPLELIELTTEYVSSESPTNVHATLVSDTSIDITWQEPNVPSNIWEIFQGYKVFIRSSGSANVNIITINAHQNFFSLPSLKSLAIYQITVALYTFAGVGKESDVINITTTLDAPPANVSAVNVTISCVTIIWDDVPSEQIGGMYVGYEVSYMMAGQESGLIRRIACNPTNEAEICNLQSFTTYKYFVRRVMLDKMGNGSKEQYFTTLEQAPLYPPTGLKCYNTSSTSLAVQWEASSMHGMNGSFVRGYKVSLKSRNITPPDRNSLIVCNSSLNATGTNLEVYTEYEIQVTALNGAGAGNYSDRVYCFTDGDVPQSGPTNITAYNLSSTSIYIQWGPAVPELLRFGESTRYIFDITEVLTGYTQVLIFDAVVLNATVGNLSKYTEYSIRGAAVNNKGQSNFTIATTIRTNEDAPDLPPVNVTAFNTSSTSIMVEFQASSPEQLNGILRKFSIVYFKAADTNPTIRNFTADLQHSRRRRASPTNNSFFQSELTGLEEFTMFSIQVSFFTVKLGPYSKVINASTDEGVPRAPPLQVTAFNSSSNSIMVTWHNLTASIVPGILLGYVLRYIRADDLNALNFVEVRHDLNTYKNISNLDPYTLYNISVAGYTRTGSGNFSETQSWTDEGVPNGPPNNVTGSALSTTSINLVWLPVTKELQNGIIRGYKAFIYGVSGYVDQTTVQSPSIAAVFEGLVALSNYSLKARAFTRKGFGPWSSLVNTSTGAEAPDQTPMDATAQATSGTTIHVTWSPVSLLDPSVLQGYRIQYFPINEPHLVMDTTAGRNDIQADLTGLRPFTTYNVRIAAFTSEDGNYTAPLYVKTWEGVPTAPPSDLGITVLNSQSLLVFWLEVPPAHQHGIIQGYELQYWNANNGSSPVITLGEYDFSYVLKQLQKATEYEVRLWAFTSVGSGSIGSYTAKTDEDVPSKPPSNIAAQNYISLTRIPISWEPVPREFLHGSPAGYRVTYQAVKIGDLPVGGDLPVISDDVGPAVTSMTLQNLEPLVVYRITVAARTNKGPGPRGVTFGETCRCRPRLTTNWRNYPPYVNLTILSEPGIIIPYLLTQVIDQCCGWCQEHNRSTLDFVHNGNNKTAKQKTVENLRRNIDNQTDFSFPVIGYKLQDSYKGGLGYSPFVESAGVAFVVYTDNSGVTDAMFSVLLSSWPIVLIPFILAYAAGVFMWLLDSHSNNEQFPGSFISGTWEGVWWAFVSMTTVGYGDRCPAGHIGRVFAVGWILIGLVVISLMMGALTTALTTITENSYPSIYGSKVGAIHGSPEYNLGVRRNAIMNRDEYYHTLEELSDALVNRKVDGVLIDTYAGGTQKELFSKPSFRVAKIVDYKTAYGVVIGRDSMRLRHCFHGYMRSHQADIFSWVEELVEPITGSGVSDVEIAQEISTGLSHSGSDLFHNTLLITGTCAVVGIVLGLCYEAVRRIRQRTKVQQDKSLSVHKDKMIKEMRLTVADFLQHSTNTLSEMKAKYQKELLKRAKRSSKRETRQEQDCTATISSVIKSTDDISMISLEDDKSSGSKC